MPSDPTANVAVTDVNDQQVASISARELDLRLKSSTPPLLVDVREQSELDGPLGHLPDILHIPIGILSSRLSELEGTDRDIVTVCRRGSRAHTAAQILAQAGFTKVYVLSGGMQAYRQRA